MIQPACSYNKVCCVGNPARRCVIVSDQLHDVCLAFYMNTDLRAFSARVCFCHSLFNFAVYRMSSSCIVLFSSGESERDVFNLSFIYTVLSLCLCTAVSR